MFSSTSGTVPVLVRASPITGGGVFVKAGLTVVRARVCENKLNSRRKPPPLTGQNESPNTGSRVHGVPDRTLCGSVEVPPSGTPARPCVPPNLTAAVAIRHPSERFVPRVCTPTGLYVGLGTDGRGRFFNPFTHGPRGSSNAPAFLRPAGFGMKIFFFFLGFFLRFAY